MRFKLLILFSIFVFCISACTTDEVVSVYGDVYGTITDAKTGNPVYNAEVILSPGNMTTVSGSNGHYEFKSLDAGQYKIGVEASGYDYNSRQVTVVPGERITCDFILQTVAVVQKLKIEPSSLDFGTTQAELAVIITNEGTVETDWSLNTGSNNWLQATPNAGRIAAGKTQSIVFAVNRDLLADQKSIIVNLAAFGNSYPITVSCSPKQTKGVLALESATIDFGDNMQEQTLKLKNVGDGPLQWTISNISVECISVSDTAGTIDVAGSKIIKVMLDRFKLSSDLATSFIVSDGTKDQTVTVKASIQKQSEPEDNVVVGSGLTAYYQFESDFKDGTGNGNDGFGVNDPTFAEGVETGSKSVKFSSATNSYVQVSRAIGDSKSLTVSFWGKNFSDGNIFYIVNANNVAIASLAMAGTSLKYVTGEYKNYHGYGNAKSFSHPTITDNKWHHIAIRVTTELDTSNMVFYITKSALFVDGLLVDEIYTGDADDIGKGKKMIIGGKYQYNNHTRAATNMTIDNFRIYNSNVLSDNDIKTIYNAKQ